MAAKIPYKIIGGVRFYDRKEVKDLLAILKLLANPHDRVSLERVAKNILAGVGQASLDKLFAQFDADPEVSLRTAAESLGGKAKMSVLRLANFIEEYRGQIVISAEVEEGDQKDTSATATAQTLELAEVVEQAVKYFDFATLVHSETPDGEERMRNLEVLASNATVYESLEEFLTDASLLSSADEANSGNAVTMMTLHAAKGLEFPIVFIVGLEEGLFPSSRSDGSEEALEEERRLAYVGMTRAMKELFLTFASSRYAFGGRTYNAPSQFLLELGYNPYGSGGFGESGAYDIVMSNDSADFGILGGDPDGEFARKKTKEDNFESQPEPVDTFDSFPEDVPVFEG